MSKVLYLGLDPARFKCAGELIHYPVIKIVPRPFTLPDLNQVTHLLFTSRSAVKIFLEGAEILEQHIVIAVGEETAEVLPRADHIACDETAEGVVDILERLDLRGASVLWPHAAKARKVISDYLRDKQVEFQSVVIYDTHAQQPGPMPALDDFTEIVFTSPSTVEAFLQIYDELPHHIRLTPIGPITAAYLKQV